MREPKAFSVSPVFMSFSSPRLPFPPLCTKEAPVQVSEMVMVLGGTRVVSINPALLVIKIL